MIDKDHSGIIDVDEIRQAVRTSQFQIGEDELHALIGRIDANDNYQIDYTEFLVSTLDLNSVLTEERIMAVFEAFDDDKTGVITFQSIKNSLTKFGREISDDEIKQIISLHDTDDDQSIDFEEFSNMLRCMKQPEKC